MFEFFNGAEFEDLYEFSTSVRENPFGVELMRTSSEIYDTIDEAVEQLAVGLTSRGVDASEEDIVGLMTGEYIPSFECLEALQDLYYDEEGNFYKDDFERLLSSAEASHELAYETAESLGLLDEDEDEDYEDESEDYEDYEDEVDGVDPEVLALREQVQAQQERQEATDTLDELTEYASNLVQEGKLPPIAFSFMLGDRQNTSSSRYAEFSSFCNENKFSLSDQLDRVAYVLQVFDQCGPLMNFSQVVLDEVNSAPVSKEEDDLIKSMFDSYKTSR